MVRLRPDFARTFFPGFSSVPFMDKFATLPREFIGCMSETEPMDFSRLGMRNVG